MDVSYNGGTQQPWVFLLRMIILVVLGVPPFHLSYYKQMVNTYHLPPTFFGLCLQGISNLNHMDSFALFGFQNSGATKNLIDWAPA